jgi:molybdopterin converting factor small subunit
MSVRIVGSGIMKQFSRELEIANTIAVSELAAILEMPENLADELIVVRGHRKLNEDELIHDGEEVALFLQIMGG